MILDNRHTCPSRAQPDSPSAGAKCHSAKPPAVAEAPRRSGLSSLKHRARRVSGASVSGSTAYATAGVRVVELLLPPSPRVRLAGVMV
jgi:hypothetical protein